MTYHLRNAPSDDHAALEDLIAGSACELGTQDDTPQQIDGALRGAFGRGRSILNAMPRSLIRARMRPTSTDEPPLETTGRDALLLVARAMSSGSRETDRASTVLTLSARTVAWVWATTTCSLTVASVLSQIYRFAFRDGRSRGWVDRLYLDKEQAIPTWFQSATLLSCAVVLYVIAAAKRRDRDPHARAWRGLALIFLCLSLDEVAALHELTSAPLSDVLHADGMWHFAWVVPGAAFVLVVGLLYVRFLLALPALTRWRFVVAGTLYVGGALGMEMVSGIYVAAHGVNTPVYAIGLVTVEELLEMVGMSLFLYALLSYLADHVGPVHVRAVLRPPIPEAKELG